VAIIKNTVLLMLCLVCCESILYWWDRLVCDSSQTELDQSSLKLWMFLDF